MGISQNTWWFIGCIVLVALFAVAGFDQCSKGIEIRTPISLEYVDVSSVDLGIEVSQVSLNSEITGVVTP